MDGDNDIAAPRLFDLIDAAWTEEEYQRFRWHLFMNENRDLEHDDAWLNDSEGPLAEWLRLFVRKHGMNLARKGLELQNMCYKLRTNNSKYTDLTTWGLKPIIATNASAVKLISHSLRCNTVLTSLNMTGNDLGPEDMRLLAQGLQQCTSLQKLCLKDNNIGDEGVRSICEWLLMNNHRVSIKKLQLRNNGITFDGANSLALALKHNNCTLQFLGLTSNEIKDEGATAMCCAIKANKSLTFLSLEGNKISLEKQLELVEALSHNFYLECFLFCNVFKLKVRRRG